MIALRFCWVLKRLASFFSVFSTTDYMDRTDFLPTRDGQGFGREMVTALFSILRKLSECSQRFRAAF